MANNHLFTEEEWQLAFQKSKSAARHALGTMDTQKVMLVIRWLIKKN